MRVAHLIASAAVAALTSLAFATPASADNTALPINPDHIGKKAGFQPQCTDPFKVGQVGDGWHFVLPGGGSFVSVKLTFSTAGDDVEVTVSGSKAAPSNGPGWWGYLDNAGAADKHAYVFTNTGWTLKAATASVTGEGQQGFFNLSHTCAGTPGTPPPPPPTPTPDPTPTSTPDPGNSETPDPSTSASTPGGNLPTTGAKVGGFVIGGVALLAGGVALLAVRRRRQITEG